MFAFWEIECYECLSLVNDSSNFNMFKLNLWIHIFMYSS